MTTILTVTLIQTKLKNPECSHQNRVTLPSCSNAPMTKNGRSAERVVGGLASVSLPKKAQAEEFKRGTRSFLWDHFFEPGLSPKDAVARIRNTAQGLHGLRHMLDTMAWRYVLFYIRLKQAYLKQDMHAALAVVPDRLKKDYVNAANELVDNMAELGSTKTWSKLARSFICYSLCFGLIEIQIGITLLVHYHVRTPKAYQSYLFYEKTLKSMDNLVPYLT
ncbi:hypothetical protein Cgig2_024871 [Carnegiea gigantea]|uniref:Uncharacterized protein n=1 Tax=Carnegiea gigantea TaxID=171969 RepID=A0A9Q1QGV8_9CARY|nr:hypothetical protein Cgig2_024871 [Carnegiea gigantea]